MFRNYRLPRFVANSNLGQLLNILGLLGISFSLIVAFYYQFWQHELPCPLCLLQRAGLMCIGFGFLMNIKFGERNLHYGLSIVSALISGAISTRQILLHIVPGSGSYGSVLLGIHFYTWGLLAAISTITYIALLLILNTATLLDERHRQSNKLGRVTMIIFSLLVAANLVTVILECGLGQCADNPTQYQLLSLMQTT
jgi:disulfide bond formation protein DsbB